MPTMFDKEDISGCFGANCDQVPAYRLITLTADGVVEGEQVGGVGVSLLCKECLVRQHNLEDIGEKIFYGKNGAPGPRDIALLVLPLHLTKQQAARLREEITEDVPLKKTV